MNVLKGLRLLDILTQIVHRSSGHVKLFVTSRTERDLIERLEDVVDVQVILTPGSSRCRHRTSCSTMSRKRSIFAKMECRNQTGDIESSPRRSSWNARLN